MARPKKKIDPEQLRKLAEKHWSTESIAYFFGVSVRTVNRRFGRAIEEARHGGKSKLLDLLWARASGAAGQKQSDRILEHLANRVLGSIKQKVEITDLSDEILAFEAERRLNGPKDGSDS